MTWKTLTGIVCPMIVATVMAGVAAWSATAQESGRPIVMIVPFSPGTGPDLLARTIGEELQRRTGQPVIVENKSGASGAIGWRAAMRAAPDGQTLVMSADPPFTANVALMKSIAYDPVTSFTPITEAAIGTLALVVHPSLPVSSTQQLIAYAKARPGQIRYGSPGVGTPHHLAMEFLKATAQVDLTHIPFRDSAGAISSLLGGDIGAMFLPVHVALPLAPDNIRILAVASRARVASAPDRPTLVELGFPDFEADIRYGVLAPAGLPPGVVSRYNKSIDEILHSPQVQERLAKQGLTTVGATPELFAENINKDLAKWGRVVKDAGITAE